MYGLLKKRKVFTILLSALLILIMGLVACSADGTSSDTDEVEVSETEAGKNEGDQGSSGVDKTSFEGELKILTPWIEFGDNFAALFEDFQKEYPNVDVILMEQTVAEFASLVASGDIPDVISKGHTVGDWVGDGLLEELTIFYEGDPSISKEMFYEPAYNRLVTADGKVWGVPWHVDPNFIFMYHPDILEQQGLTEFPTLNSLIELEEFLSKFWIVEEGEQVMSTFYPHEIYGPINTLQTIANANGAKTSDFYNRETNTAHFNHPLIVEALEWLVQFKRENIDDERMHNLHATLPEGLGPFQAKKRFLEAHVTANLVPNYEVNPEIAFAPMPDESLWLGGWDFAITSMSENKELAWEFIKWIGATDEGAASTLDHFGWISGKVDNPSLEELAEDNPIFSVALEMLPKVENAHLASYLPVYYEDVFNEKWNEVIYDATLEPVAFLDYMNDYIQGLLDEWATTQ